MGSAQKSARGHQGPRGSFAGTIQGDDRASEREQNAASAHGNHATVGSSGARSGEVLVGFARRRRRCGTSASLEVGNACRRSSHLR